MPDKHVTPSPSSAVRTLRRPVGSAAVWPWLAVLVITGGFHLYRGASADGIVFLLVAAVLVADSLHVFPESVRRAPGRLHAATMTAGALCGGALLILSPLDGVTDGVVVAVIAAAALLLAWPNPPLSRRRKTPAEAKAVRRTAIVWAAVGIAGCLWELGAYVMAHWPTHLEDAWPRLSTLVDPFVHDPLGRALLVTLWLLGGFALLRRGPRR